MDNDEGASEFRHRPTHDDVTTLLSASLASNATVVDNGDVGMTSSSAVATAIQYQENVPSPIHSTLRRMTSRGSGSNTSTYNAMTNYDHANEDSHWSNCDAPARERPAVSSALNLYCIEVLITLNLLSLHTHTLTHIYFPLTLLF